MCGLWLLHRCRYVFHWFPVQFFPHTGGGGNIHSRICECDLKRAHFVHHWDFKWYTQNPPSSLAPQTDCLYFWVRQNQVFLFESILEWYLTYLWVLLTPSSIPGATGQYTNFKTAPIFSSVSSRLGFYYGLSFLVNRLFWLFMIHTILTRL